jgi:hypothetical protein
MEIIEITLLNITIINIDKKYEKAGIYARYDKEWDCFSDLAVRPVRSFFIGPRNPKMLRALTCTLAR